MKGLSNTVSTQTVPLPVTSAIQRGQLLDFDTTELIGWIAGDDGAIYGFSAADVVDEKDIGVGAAVLFESDGEAACQVRAIGDDLLWIPQVLSGALLSYDPATLTGWIGVEGGGVYLFTAADVLGEEELAVGQSLSFLGAGERATQVLPTSLATQSARGHLLSYDANEMCGWIRGIDDQIYAFSAADLVEDGEVADGQAVSFVAQGDRAGVIRVLSMPAVRRVEGTLLSYDAVERRGWITGDDSNLYSFTAGDVVGEVEIEASERVDFLVMEEQATQVRALPGAAFHAMRGTLLSYDKETLCGWIVGEDANLYGFTAADVQGDEEIVVGQSVVFAGALERATSVGAGEPAATKASLAGTLLSYDPSDLIGWIAGQDGIVYGFSAADLEEDAEIAVGRAVRFDADGERATRVSAVPELPVQAMEGTLLGFDVTSLRGWISCDDGNLYGFTVADVLDEGEIESGCRLAFMGAAERATQVQSKRQAPKMSHVLRGTLVSFDNAELLGWIEGEDGNMYGFTAVDLLDDVELAPGQTITFRGTDERATDIRAIETAPARSLEGTLQTYDEIDLIGLIHGTDGTLYEFTGADLVGDEEIKPGRAVTFIARGDQASEVCAAPIAPAQTLEGSLLSYDPAELSGWISREDGALYAFTAADVVGDEDIRVGQDVTFSGSGERARQVRARVVRTLEFRSLRGKLLSYDVAELCGWIEGEDGNLYAFAADDVVGEEEIGTGQAVAFKGADERAMEVRAVDPETRPKPMKGKLLSYSAEELEGWISGEDRATYRFDVGDLLSDAEIRLGQTVSFVAIGTRATQIAEVASAPLPVPATPLRAPVVIDVTVTPQPDSAAVPERVRRSRMLWALAASVVAALGVGAIAASRFLYGPAALAPVSVALNAPPAPPAARSEETASQATQPPAKSATSDDVPSGERGEAAPASLPHAPTISGAPSLPARSKASAAQEVTPTSAPPTVTSPPTRKPAATAAAGSTSSTGGAASHPASVSPASTASGEAVGWWMASVPGHLNVVYAGRVAELSAIALMFDGAFANAEAINQHVRVTRQDGTPTPGRWALGRNPRMVLLPARPGRYEVSVGAGLADATGRAVKTTQQGPVVVE